MAHIVFVSGVGCTWISTVYQVYALGRVQGLFLMVYKFSATCFLNLEEFLKDSSTHLRPLG